MIIGRHAAALADLNAAICLQSGFMDIYVNRGMAQLSLGNIDAAKSDFQIALELAEQQENDNLKTFVEEQLHRLSQGTSKRNNEKPRRGGQWKGKVKIAEDFDKLPESFMKVFGGDDE